jgi:DNA-directed RNA polymerase subunit RPC12/RpoP
MFFLGWEAAFGIVVKSLRDMSLAKLAFGVRCLRCRHRRTVYPHSLMLRFGVVHPIDDVPRRFVCSKCGARAPGVAVEYLWR